MYAPGNCVAGQRSRRSVFRATLAGLHRMPDRGKRDEWERGWRGAHAITLDGLPGRLAARVRTVRAGVTVAARVIRQAAERDQG